MERAIKAAMESRAEAVTSMIAAGRLDAKSIVYAVAGAAGFFALGVLCLSLWRFDTALASIWLPNAIAVALLLRARLKNEVVVYGGFAIASFGANIAAGNPAQTAMIFTAANLIEIAIVTWLTRRTCGERPDMTDLAHLGRFIKYGGLVGPILSASIAAIAMSPDKNAIWSGASSWFLADSMGMLLIVPAVLLTFDAIRTREEMSRAELAERIVLMICGYGAVYMVFQQNMYPLLFLVPPITMLFAFRLGGLGTALYVPGVALVASWMTYAGHGPIAMAAGSGIIKMNLIQAFVAANFLTGLPIAAILAGRERMTEELEQGKQRLDLLAANITDAIMRYDLQGICTYASYSVQDVLGEEPESLIGKRISEQTHEDARERILLAEERLENGTSEKERFTYRRFLDNADGTPVFIEAECAIATNPLTGERDGMVLAARDVTERVELELLLTRARRHAENAARAKSEFLANMSHEIRTPMNGVLGFAELMLQGDLDEEQSRHIEMIVQSGRSMMLLLNDILDLSKIEAGQIAIDLAPVDLYATISECAALHRPSAEKKGLELVFRYGRPDEHEGALHEQHRPWVATDALRLRQIILNLVGNAVKFTAKGRVDVRYWADESQFCVEVSDTGIGIAPSRLETIFHPFTQAESDTSRRFGGTGLGLTISRQLAELLGGFIDVTSEAGAGSAFRLTLPAVYASPDHDEAGNDEMIEPESLPQSARILLAEDHDVNRLLGTEMLERCGQSVAIAHDGNEAIAMVIDSMMRGSPYDLVLMDIQMPGCDGYAATRAIRKEGIGPDMMPIIALTANAFPEDIAAARAAGMQAHLAKPLVFSDLARVLQRWLPTRIIDALAEDADAGLALAIKQPRQDRYREEGGNRATEGADRADEGFELDIVDAQIVDPELVLFDDMSDPFAMPDEAGAPLLFNSQLQLRGARASGAGQGSGSASGSSRNVSGLIPHNHSPALISRWNQRRSEAVEAVRCALESGALGDGSASAQERDTLARMVHKLAGTAAIFGEPDLGDQAAALERALRMELSGDVQEALAFELLSVADDPADSFTAA